MSLNTITESYPQILRDFICDSDERVTFTPGQQLSTEDSLPGQIFIILSGTVRILIEENDKTITLCKKSEGSIIGLASLVSVQSCENVHASTDVEAIAINSQTVLSWLNNNKEFLDWCNTRVWEVEAYRIIKLIKLDYDQKPISLKALTLEIINDIKLIDVSQESLEKAISSNRRIYIASGNCDASLGTEVNLDIKLPDARPPLPIRIISLSSNSYNKIIGSITTKSVEAPQWPTRNSANFGQPNPILDFEIIKGIGTLDEILACFQMLSKLLKLTFRRDAVERVVRDSLRRGQIPNLQLCGSLASMLGLHAVGAKVFPEMGTRMSTPAILEWNKGFALALSSNGSGLTIASPSEGIILIKPDELKNHYPNGIEIVVIEKTNRTPEQRFGPSWFFPALKKYQSVLIQVLIASFVVQLFTLANPLLIQIIIDKVINQRSLDTLQVLGIALVGVTIFEGILGSLRTFLFAQTTNRIDMRLGAEVIDHLLRLPLDYFDKRPVGELGTRVAELEKIRQFLTGQALTTIIDTAFSIIYIGVMLLYSWVLTIVALVVVPIQVLFTIIGAPLFRRQYRQAAIENAKTQSHLVEILTGIQTVKAQNVEMISRWKWQDLYAGYISRTFEKTVTGVSLTEIGKVLQNVSQLAVLWVGASMVLSGNLTLGQLIAFRIISGYVTQPLLRLTTIWQNIQELKVSFERLADVVDTPQESNDSDQAKIPLPPISGEVEYQNVSFSFISDKNKDVLKNINLTIKPGTFVGVAGQSGSGKSTLMKLLPRLYSPRKGRILLDGYDIDKIELYSLRRQIGIVPQDPLLFAGSVSENIALTDPDAKTDDIVKAARLACAHDFIMELQAGYSSNVGERGSTLSGGQRQRLAIARTLLSNPRLLVLDEATSALDYETERKVCDNLRDSLKECTTFFITHRLSTIKRADIILLLHQGVIAESGTHEELLELKGRYYALYRQQEGI